MNPLDQFTGLLDSKTAHVLTLLSVGAGVVGRIYKAVVNGGGFVSIWHALLYGTNTPNPQTESETVKITNIIPVIITALLLCFAFTGCQATSNANRRVVHGAGSFTKIGVGENMATGLYELGILHGQTTFTIVPILFATNALTGNTYVVVPDVADSYETTGANSVFGRGGITSTFATGTNAVGSLLGGNHYPVNDKTQISTGLNATIPR